MFLTDSVTVLIFTRNRQDYLLNLLSYLQHINLNILVLDGSDVPIQLNSTEYSNVKKIDLISIEKEKAITDTMWAAYLKTYQTDEEKELSTKAQMYIDDADKYFEEIVKDDTVTDAEAKQMDEKIYPVLRDVNSLIDIQTTIGAKDTKAMITLLDNFSNFMIGVIALGVALLGSIIYDIIKKPVVPQKPVKKAPKKVVKKPAVKKKK